MELSSSNIEKDFVIFWETIPCISGNTELCYILGNGNPK